MTVYISDLSGLRFTSVRLNFANSIIIYCQNSEVFFFFFFKYESIENNQNAREILLNPVFDILCTTF